MSTIGSALVTALAVLAGCGFEHGTPAIAATVDGAGGDRDGASGGGDGGNSDATSLDDSAPGAITYVGHTIGKSSNATVTIASTAMPGATYVAGVATKPFRDIASVTGLGATWTRIADQCGARSQTGASVYIGRGAVSSGNVVVTLESAPLNTVAFVAVYSGSGNTGTFAMYNALDASTCTASSQNVDVNMYTFAIAATNRVVTAVATRQYTHTPGAGLTQRLQDTQGSSGDTAGIALVDGFVTNVSGSFPTDVDVAAVAVELRP